ncbi:helix-turn-helix transcriptional regulator [Clostridiaceae bacterium M8S5]|nr:helix-turn-helix transcriptional regulator [Clostridiaceae bacterium M8S5]
MELLKSISDFSTVGGKIKYYRLLKEKTQEELSNLTGIDRTTIIKYEHNQLLHSLELCNKIATALCINPFLLYDDYLAFIASDFSNKIKEYRESKNLTQKELGLMLGVHWKTVGAWEGGNAVVSRRVFSMFDKLSFS